MNIKKTMVVTASAFLLSASITGAGYAAKEDRKGIEIAFKDTSGMTWVKDSIGRMKSKGIFQGYSDGIFKPYAPVTRIQSVITVVRMLGLEDEALSKTNVTNLHFKDAASINAKYYGYLSVALEAGVLTADEKVFSAYKPASRVWISELLVRALALEEEAKQAETETPEFKDTDDMTTEEIGFVNVASELEIFAGSIDGYFNPADNITRAQMAAVLDRTYGNLLEENGAVTVNGSVSAIAFSGSEGTIAVSNFNGEQEQYKIAKDLLVQFHTRFITADQLRAGDLVELYIENGTVVEAAIYTETPKESVQSGIQKIKVEAELADGTEFELSYSNKKGKEKGTFEFETGDDEKDYRDNEAFPFIQDYLQQWNLTPEMSSEEAEAAVIASFNQELKELELKVKFSNGQSLKIESDDEQEDEDVQGEEEETEEEQEVEEQEDEEQDDEEQEVEEQETDEDEEQELED